jgi:hypothetical protein
MDSGHIVKLHGILKFTIKRKAPRRGGYFEIYIIVLWIVDKVYDSNIVDGRLTAFHYKKLGYCESLHMGSDFKDCSIRVV